MTGLRECERRAAELIQACLTLTDEDGPAKIEVAAKAFRDAWLDWVQASMVGDDGSPLDPDEVARRREQHGRLLLPIWPPPIPEAYLTLDLDDLEEEN